MHVKSRPKPGTLWDYPYCFIKAWKKNGVHASLPLANKLRVLNLNLNKNATEKFEHRWQNFWVEAIAPIV